MTAPFRDAHRRTAGAALLVATILLTACAAPHPVRTLGDGALQVDCPGGYHDWSACHAAARKYCGKREYRVVSQTSNEGGAVGRGDWSREGSEVARTMEFRCVP